MLNISTMKKNQLSICVLLLLPFFLAAQSNKTVFTVDDFDFQFMTYKPIERQQHVDSKDYDRGQFILEETRKSIENDHKGINYADYWNITMAFIRLGESKSNIETAFKKAISINPSAICDYVDTFGEKSVNTLMKVIPEIFLPFYEKCETEYNSQPKEEFIADDYAEALQLDKELVKIMHQIGENDQKYRKNKKVDWSKQTALDKENMSLIDQLFQEYGKYIGRDLVGKDFESTMWAVIQHSTIEKMEEYLSVVQEGVKAGNLAPTPLKMLLDRISCYRNGKQYFGSQFGSDCKIATEKERLKIEEKYFKK